MKNEILAPIVITIVFTCAISFIVLYPTIFTDQLSREEFLISGLISDNSDRLPKASIKMQEAIIIQQNLTNSLLLSDVLYPEMNESEFYYTIYLPEYNKTTNLINESNILIQDYDIFTNDLSRAIRNYEDKAKHSINTLATALIMLLVFMYAVFVIYLIITWKKKKQVCPFCQSSSIRKRKHKKPPYVCDNPKCKKEFDEPDIIKT